jgi:putative RecB family exonuclease
MSELRLSPSRLGDFMNCPQLYKYRVIDRLPEPLSLDAERGTLVHDILEELFNSPADERTMERALEIMPNKWQSQQEEKPELVDLVSSQKEWLDRVIALLTNYFSLENPTTFESTFRELHVESTLSDLIYLHGYVDRLDIAPTGEVRIVDYKTGKAPKPGWEEKAFFQLQIYALLYWRNEKVLPKLLQLIYLGNSQILKSVPTEAELDRTERKVLNLADEIHRAMAEDKWTPKPTRLCDWCFFKAICPAHN